MSEIIYTTEQELPALLAEGKSLVDFYADWCAPCRMIAPVLEQLATENTELKIIKVNVDENPGVGETYNIQGIPALRTFKDGILVEEANGFRPKESLQELIDRI